MAKKLFTTGFIEWCTICKRRTTFYSIGKQTCPNSTLHLWNCHECGGTITTVAHTGNTGILQEVAP